ncbi:DUF4160 domain-containing protein [Pseudomonas sp. S2_E01]
MEKLNFFFNELCVEHLEDQEISEAHWNQSVSQFVDTALTIFEHRPDGMLAVPEGTMNKACGGKILLSRIRENTGSQKDKYRKILSRITTLSPDFNLTQEVRHSNNPGNALTLADFISSLHGHGWAISLQLPNQTWELKEINAQRFTLNDTGDFNDPVDCSIDHISKTSHINDWITEIQDWGKVISNSSVLDSLNEHPIVMYSGPLEHNPPHVHLLQSRNSPTTLAKYNIDPFERSKGDHRWDTEMKAWIDKYRDQLLQSWVRCQTGKHPYELRN